MVHIPQVERGWWIKPGKRMKWHRIHLLFDSGYASLPCGLMYHVDHSETQQQPPPVEDQCKTCATSTLMRGVRVLVR